MSGTEDAMGKGSELSALMTGEGAGRSTSNRYSGVAQNLGMKAS